MPAKAVKSTARARWHFINVDKSANHPLIISCLPGAFRINNVYSGPAGLQGVDGVAVIDFPQRAKGTRDFILLDDEMQVTVGNRGSVVIVKRR